MEARLIASMISNGNEVLGDSIQKTMTPINCEDTALQENFVYAEIVMCLILKLRLCNRNFWKISKVGNLTYTDFILNIGNQDELIRLNKYPPTSAIRSYLFLPFF